MEGAGGEDGLPILPLEVLVTIIKQGGVSHMDKLVRSVGNRRLYQAWQLAVTSAQLLLISIGSNSSQRDVQLFKQFENLQKIIIIAYRHDAGNRSSMSPWQLVAQVAPALSKLRTIDLSGPHSFEVLKVLQGSQQLRHQITELRLDHDRHAMTADDMYGLAHMEALEELWLQCSKLPPAGCEALAIASEALNKTLQRLSLTTKGSMTPADTAAFPGQLTSLKQLWLSDESKQDDEDCCSAITAAVPSLVKLQNLSLEPVTEWTAEQQQQALAGLTCLTCLHLMGDAYVTGCGQLALVPAADTLVVLDVKQHDITGEVADALFSLAALQRIKARTLLPSEAWQGQVAQGCRIEELELHADQPDENLRNLPTLPALKCFLVQQHDLLPSGGGRYQHLARFLHHHAATLETIHVKTGDDKFSEALPDLPVCTFLCIATMVGRR